MSREVYARFCERRGVRSPPPTHRCLIINGTKADAETLREEIAGVLSAMGLRLSPEKTLVTHIDEGPDFLGWRIQRHRKRGTSRYYVYTYPAKKSLRAVMAKVKTLCRQVGVNPGPRQSRDSSLFVRWPTSWPGASLPRWSRPGARFQQQACSDIWCISRLCRGPGGEPAAGSPAAPAQPGSTGLVRLLRAQRACTVRSEEVGTDGLTVRARKLVTASGCKSRPGSRQGAR